MKHSIMKCIRWQLQWRSCLILVPAAMLFFVLSAQAQIDEFLPPMGGSGGGQFIARCPQGQHLTGFELRTGNDVDAIRLICVTAYGPADVGPPVAGGESFGGDGPGLGTVQLLCPRDAPIVIGMYVQSEGVDAEVVNNVHLWCGVADSTQRLSVLPNAVFDGPIAQHESTIFTIKTLKRNSDTQYCPGGLVAVGINGRSGIWLDAVGLICGAPKLTSKPVPPPESTPVEAVGRVKVPPGTPPSAPISICESARRARALNNAAAYGLEARCRAAGAAGEIPPKAPVKDLGRVEVSPGTPPNEPRPTICEDAREARARNNAAAPGLAAQCRSGLAATGAAIAEADPIVAGARAIETDVLYRVLYQQGFDIATAIFGDPARGAQGNTATGPGSLEIRNALSAAGQRGFNDSVKLHLSRNYKR